MTQPPIGSVFMSYSRKDEGIMRRTTAFLRGKGITVWVDNEKLVPGTPIWEAEIEKAIRAASAVVIFMSPDSKDSEWVRREITLADQYRKRIFPVLVRGDEDSSITLRLVTRQFVDVRGNEKVGLNSLHRAVSQYLNELNGQDQVSPTEAITSTHVTAQDPAAFSTANSPGLMVAWLALGWAITGVIAGYLWSEFDDTGGELIAGVFGGGIGGLITALLLRAEKTVSNRISIIRSMLAWAIGGAIGWLIGWQLSGGTVAGGFGMAVMATAGLAGMLGMEYVRVHWQGTAMIILAWFIGGALIWIISNMVLIDSLSMDDKGLAWGIGTAIGWAIGGYVLGWQLLKTGSGSSKEAINSYQPSRIKLTETQKAFLLSARGRSLLGVIVGLILGILFGVVYGIYNDISYDFAYAYSTFYGDVPNIFLLIICGFAGFVAYPHRVTVLLLIGGFIVILITGLSQRYVLYELLAFGGIYGLPAGALISRILYWLKVVK